MLSASAPSCELPAKPVTTMPPLNAYGATEFATKPRPDNSLASLYGRGKRSGVRGSLERPSGARPASAPHPPSRHRDPVDGSPRRLSRHRRRDMAQPVWISALPAWLLSARARAAHLHRGGDILVHPPTGSARPDADRKRGAPLRAQGSIGGPHASSVYEHT